MIKLIASDMDGTLVTGHIEISKFTADAVKKAQEMGITFIAATGRNFQEASTPLKNAGIHCGIVGVNGAMVYDEDGNKISSTPLSKESVLQLLEIFKEFDVYPELATNKGIFSENQAQRLDLFAANMAENVPYLNFKQALTIASTTLSFFHIQYVESILEVVKRSDIEPLKFFIMSEKGEVELSRLQEKVKSTLDDVVITSSGKHNIEINHVHAQKGIAIEKIATEMGITADEVMTIGDSFNDVSMLDYASVSFAMGQANEEIKSHAKYIAETNENDGVGKAILRAIEENL